MSYRDSEQFHEGIGRFMKEAEIDEENRGEFTKIVLEEVDEGIRQVKAAQQMGLAKSAALESAGTDLDRLILKEAMRKEARIEERDCTDSDGNKGSFVVLSESGKQLGCHSSRSKAVDQLQAIEASKSASEGD